MKHSSTQKTKRRRNTNVMTRHDSIPFFPLHSYFIVKDRAFNYTPTHTPMRTLTTSCRQRREIVCTEACPAAHGIVTSRYVFPAQTAKRG
ncbi:hypothetical protein CEXT_706201 [Caerostris extrusa]|uniref:Uncharacterized protein n=1 Tax=Caerostris extrusa TaxID=172846 RepID=A0AAV4XCB9_CAEEX|nr:hypothetical protein CEXT_706201 [Caerostris extrusa]